MWFDLLEFMVLFLACLTVIIVTVMNYRRGGIAFIDFRNFAKKKLDHLFKEVNQKKYAERHLKW